MKNIILSTLAFTTIAIGLVACSKTKTSTIKIGAGTITGMDPKMCSCCGGYILYMNNKNNLIANDLEAKNAALSWQNIKIPVDVKLMYSAENTCGGNTLLEVDDIEICK